MGNALALLEFQFETLLQFAHAPVILAANQRYEFRKPHQRKVLF